VDQPVTESGEHVTAVTLACQDFVTILARDLVTVRAAGSMARRIHWVQFNSLSWAIRHSQQTLSTHTIKEDATNAGVKVAKANSSS
jgi:hypothetical protein